MEEQSMLEKGRDGVAVSDPLAKEVYGIALTVSRTGSGEVQTERSIEYISTPSKAVTWGLIVRSWIRSVGAEEGGIERIPEELRTNQHPYNLFTLWSSANVGTVTLAFGTLGPGLLYLGWWDSFCFLLFFNIIGALPPALMATLGPKLGLRTMTILRYAFGMLQNPHIRE
jgi:hypothetical protein